MEVPANSYLKKIANKSSCRKINEPTPDNLMLIAYTQKSLLGARGLNNSLGLHLHPSFEHASGEGSSKSAHARQSLRCFHVLTQKQFSQV